MSAAVAMRGITRVYPGGVAANNGVDFTLEAGEIHALLGENGAGKSTLMRVLYGLEQPDVGTISVRGVPAQLSSPRVALGLGICMVQQHDSLAPDLSVAENIVLGAEPRRLGLFDRRRATAQVEQLATRYGLAVNPATSVSQLSPGMRQRVEILKALYRQAQILILDEPTALLTPQEVDELFTALRGLAAAGMSIVLITHRPREVAQIATRATVMRRGHVVAVVELHGQSHDELAALMVGTLPQQPPHPQQPPGAIALELRAVSMHRRRGQPLADITLSIGEGEILGLAGIEGSGQEELAELLAGLDEASSGTILLAGRPLQGLSPRARNSAGVAYMPSDRMRAVPLEASVADGLILRRYHAPPLARWGWWQDRAEVRRYATDRLRAARLQLPDTRTPAHALSGGMLQRLILSRELDGQLRLLIICQPTRGLDVAASAELHREILRQREAGAAILLISSDLAELVELSDRVAVIADGTIVKLIERREDLSEVEIGSAMLGGTRLPATEVR